MYALDLQDPHQLIAAIDALHPADIADLLKQINPYYNSRLISLCDREFDGEILAELKEGLGEEIIGLFKPDVLADAVHYLESDDVVNLIEDLEDKHQKAVVEVLVDSDRVGMESALNCPEHSAGRLMQRKLLIAPEYWQVGDAIEHLRASQNLPEQFYHVTLVDGKRRPVANVSLGRLMATRRNVALKDMAEEIFQLIPLIQDESDVKDAFDQ